MRVQCGISIVVLLTRFYKENLDTMGLLPHVMLWHLRIDFKLSVYVIGPPSFQSMLLTIRKPDSGIH